MSFLGLIVRSRNMSFGYNSVKDEIYSGKVKLILVAADLSEKSKNNILFLSKNSDVECIQIYETMLDISNFLGKYSGILGILNEDMALNIKKIINEDCSGRN